jgi:hypothetical protein
MSKPRAALASPTHKCDCSSQNLIVNNTHPANEPLVRRAIKLDLNPADQ